MLSNPETTLHRASYKPEDAFEYMENKFCGNTYGHWLYKEMKTENTKYSGSDKKPKACHEVIS